MRVVSYDTNLVDFRGDFVARRGNTDVPDACLRPQLSKQRATCKREAVPVYGA